MLADIILYMLIPGAAIVCGGFAAVFWVPSAQVRSSFQHLAAGVVFAAVAGELLPKIMHEAKPVPVVIGFVAGVALMLGIKWFFGHGDEESEGGGEGSLVVIIGLDIAIDGLLVGVSFSAGTEAGILVTIALSLEVLFLALSTSATLIGSGASRARVVATVLGFAAILVGAAALGAVSVNSLSASVLEGVLSFGVAALLYLVTEELLVEAHEVEETPLTTATFFVGFLLIILIEMSM